MSADLSEVDDLLRDTVERWIAHVNAVKAERDELRRQLVEERAATLRAIDDDVEFYAEHGRLNAEEAKLVTGVLRALRRTLNSGGHLGGGGGE